VAPRRDEDYHISGSTEGRAEAPPIDAREMAAILGELLSSSQAGIKPRPADVMVNAKSDSQHGRNPVNGLRCSVRVPDLAGRVAKAGDQNRPPSKHGSLDAACARKTWNSQNGDLWLRKCTNKAAWREVQALIACERGVVQQKVRGSRRDGTIK
jgi:hypothetical protein